MVSTIEAGQFFIDEFKSAFKPESNSWNFALSAAASADRALIEITRIANDDRYTAEQKAESIKRVTDSYSFTQSWKNK